MPRLREEILPYVTAEGDAQGADIQHLELLNGVIHEALRLNPPVPSVVQRVTPPKGMEVWGRHIPGNVKGWSPQYVVGRNEEVYERATKFVPERWFSRPEILQNDGKAFAPFSLEPTGCIGKPLALMEIRAASTKSFTDFDVTLAPEEDGHRLLNKTRDRFMLGLAPLKVIIKAKSRVIVVIETIKLRCFEI